MGPLISRAAVSQVASYIADGVVSGATLVVDGANHCAPSTRLLCEADRRVRHALFDMSAIGG